MQTTGQNVNSFKSDPVSAIHVCSVPRTRPNFPRSINNPPPLHASGSALVYPTMHWVGLDAESVQQPIGGSAGA